MKRVSNSYNYLFFKTIKINKERKRCPVIDYLSDLNPVRTIGLFKGSKIDIYYTDTKDFNDEQLAWFKYEKGQIYRQRDNKTYINDFKKQLIKMNIHPYCNRCIYKFSCPNIWVEEKKDLFEESEKIVRSLLIKMRGNVLDIGCGSINLYEGILKNLSINNKINYTGIDPNSKSIKNMKKLYKDYNNIKFIKTTIEKYPAKDIKYDYVLLLRSINHIKNTTSLFKKIKKILKKGGKLLIVDNIPFGVIRDGSFLSDTNKKPIKNPVFEHFHNYDSIDILRFLRVKHICIKLHTSVTMYTSNQWLLLGFIL
ncbi:MAG: class I SAM-dependent methyltransferase [Myxococcota bacterium]